MELLTVAAGELLARLMGGSGAPIGSEPGDIAADDPALLELRECGLVTVSGRRAVPVAPTSMLANLLAYKQRELMDSHRRLLADYERLMSQEVTWTSTRLEFLTCEADILAALGALQAEASGEYRAIDLLPSQPVQRPQVPHRLIYTKNLLSGNGLVLLDGWQYRVMEDLPLRMALSDATALIMLSSAGQAAVVRVPAVTTALRHYFDLLWRQAAPLDGGEGQLTKTQRLILGMLLSGLGDDAIARSLGVSSRSVRRQVAALELLAGVSSRFALGAAAVRRGWIDPGGDAVR
jgi:DNA-binding CsgD family transcriptional regulator